MKQSATVTIQRDARRKTADGDFELVPVQYAVDVVVDFARIADKLGPRAFKSKGKRSQFLFGAIVATVRDIRDAKPAADRPAE